MSQQSSPEPNDGNEKHHRAFDRLFRQAFAGEIDEVMRIFYGLKTAGYELIDPTFPTVSEMEADFAFRFRIEGEDRHRIGQLEIQTRPDADMLQRCLLYSAHFYQKYKQVPNQYVLHLGTEPWNYPTELDTEDLTYRFRLIRLAELSSELLLGSSSLSIAILAVLGKTQDPEAVLHLVLKRLERAAPEPLLIKRYATVLLIAAGLRKFEFNFIQTLESMPIVLDNLKDHPLYQIVGNEKARESYHRGKEEGMEEGMEKGVEKGKQQGKIEGKTEAAREIAIRLLQQQFAVSAVSNLTGLSENEVEEIRRQIGNRPETAIE